MAQITQFPGDRKPTREEAREQRRAEVGDRIRRFRTQRGLNQPQLAELLGVTKNAVTNWEAGSTRPGFSLIPKLCSALRISADQLFGIPPRETPLSAQDRAHAEAFRRLNESNRQCVDALISAMLGTQRQAMAKELSDRVRHVAAIDLALCAGDGDPLEDAYDTDDCLLRRCSEVDRADALVRVSGRSMEPTFHDGDTILIELTDELSPGEIGAFYYNGTGLVKEYRADGLYPHNPDYDPIYPQPDDALRLVGRVLGPVTDDMRLTAEERIALEEAGESPR